MPKPTILDKLIYDCNSMSEMPFYKGMLGYLQNMAPSAHVVRPDESQMFSIPIHELPPPPEPALPGEFLKVPSPVCYCLEDDRSIPINMSCHHMGNEHSDFFQGYWFLAGAMVSEIGPDVLEIMPIGVTVQDGKPIIFPELPASCGFRDGKWDIGISYSHPVHDLLYNLMLKDLDAQQVQYIGKQVAHKGKWLLSDIASYMKHVDKSAVETFRPSKPRVKMKDGKVKKIYRLPALGYSRVVTLDELNRISRRLQ